MTISQPISLLRVGAACTLAGLLLVSGAGPRRTAEAARFPDKAAAASHAASGVALAKITLSLHDVTAAFGGGFIPEPGANLESTAFGSRLNATVGRIAGYTTGYIRQHPNPVMLNSGVNLFKNTAFASAAVRRVYTVFSSPKNKKEAVHVEHLHGIGDTGLVLSYDLGIQKGVHFHELTVMFSRGAYAADVILVAGGSLDRAKLLALAGTMDGRIKSA